MNILEFEQRLRERAARFFNYWRTSELEFDFPKELPLEEWDEQYEAWYSLNGDDDNAR